MRKFKENLEYLQLLLENKDRLIDRLDLTDDQKTELKSFFKKHPGYENKIDWNRKDLTFADFKDLLALEGKSRSQAKKKGLPGLTEGTDYKILLETPDYAVYYPMTHLGSQMLASPKIAPKVTGEWCISMNKSTYWDSYTDAGADFFFVFTTDRKYAIARLTSIMDKQRNTVKGLDAFTECFDQEDNKITIAILKSQIPKDLAAKLDSLIGDSPKFLDEALYKAPDGCIYTPDRQTLKAAHETKDTVIIDKAATTIKSQAFEYNETLKKVILPDSVTRIEPMAFRGCRSLTEVRLPQGSCPDLEREAFKGCYKLSHLEIPEGFRQIEFEAFCQSGISEISVPWTVESIGESAFAYTLNLKHIDLSECRILELGPNVFSSSGLTSLVMPAYQANIPEGLCYGCSSLESVDLRQCTGGIKDSAFRNCRSLKTVLMGPSWGTRAIQDRAFDYTGLETIDFSESTAGLTFGAEIFRNCYFLKSIRLPGNVKFLSTNAFENCPNLKDIYYAGPKERWSKTHIDLDYMIKVLQQSGNNFKFTPITATVHCTDGELQDTVGWTAQRPDGSYF